LLGGSESEAVASSLLFFRPPKELDLNAPTISLDLEEGEEGVTLTLATDVLAKDVYLRLDGARFSNNFFDLLPGRPQTVFIQTRKALEEVRAGLMVRTLAEVPAEGTPVEGGEGQTQRLPTHDSI
jgi:beta-mannosidase